MIKLFAKIHDKFSLEFKVSYITQNVKKRTPFKLKMWIFVPASLDINRYTYKRDDFYKDLRNNMRLITPVFDFFVLSAANSVPLMNLEYSIRNLQKSTNQNAVAEFEYQIKMFAAIFKSSLRDKAQSIHLLTDPQKKEHEILFLLKSLRNLLTFYRSLETQVNLPPIPQLVQGYFNFGDEFLTNLTEKELFALLHNLRQNDPVVAESINEALLAMLENEEKHKREKQFMCINPSSKSRNSEFVFRMGSLKKYIESDLFLNAKKKRDGVFVEQLYYSIAAGISMIFATGVAFSIQQKYGNYTMPLFVALVVSYILKDRIKELIRYYFAHKISSRYFDNKTSISVKNSLVGISKESFDCIPTEKVPSEILKVRNRISLIEAQNKYEKEQIFLFRKQLKIKKNKLDAGNTYVVDGIVEIIRYNFKTLIRNTDNPHIPLSYMNSENQVDKVMADKNYYLNIVIQYVEEKCDVYQRFRVGFNRDGISSLNEIT